MTGAHGDLRWFTPSRLRAWPVWMLLVFASLAVVRLLPAGDIRAAVAVPIVLVVPGALTLGAVFSERNLPRGVMFVCFAVLLSAIWSVLASLGLYALGVRITAGSTYFCLLIVSVVLAIAVEARLLLGQSGGGHRVGRDLRALNAGLSDGEAEASQVPVTERRASVYGMVAVAAGVSVLAGGLYAYEHLPRPAPAGYTWIAWTSSQGLDKPVNDAVGIELHFQIANRQSETAAYRLTAEWLGTPPRPLASPVSLSIGPGRTFGGALVVPPLPDGCADRIVVTLTALHQIDPLTKKLQAWSINADVQNLSKPSKTCK
jgi:hypothetical protein